MPQPKDSVRTFRIMHLRGTGRREGAGVEARAGGNLLPVECSNGQMAQSATERSSATVETWYLCRFSCTQETYSYGFKNKIEF